MMSEEESKHLSYIQATRPELLPGFQQRITEGRRGILQRLVQAIVRENIAGLGERTRWEVDGGTTVLFLDLSREPGSQLRIPVARRFSLGRFDVGPGSIKLLSSRGGDWAEIEHPVQLVDLLEGEGLAAGAERLARFRHEVDNSAANLALALAGAAVRWETVALETCRSSLAFAANQSAEDDTFSPLAFFEQLVVEGHPLHPSAKTKMALDVADVIRYSPEFGATPEVILIAVRREACRYSTRTGKSPSDILYADHPHLRAEVATQMGHQRLLPEEYELIPVHPWQRDHTLPAMYGEALRKREVVPLPTARIPTHALMSFRSLAPFQPRGAGKHHIKTAVNVQLTNAVRTVSSTSAHNGPLLSRMLSIVVDRERGFDNSFLILREEVGVYYCPISGDATLEKNLACILRENPEDHVMDRELAMPGSALLATSPVSGKVIVAEVIAEFATTRAMNTITDAAVAFVREYAAVAMPGFLTLMSRYGVALEGHSQNSVVVFRDGIPVRVIIRDFGGVRLLRERMARQKLEVDFYPGSSIVTDDVNDMREKLFYSVIQNHIGELVAAIVRSLGVDEDGLWAAVADVCKRVFAELQRDTATRQQALDDEAALFAPTLLLKCLATMRILGDVTTYTFATVPNPLHLAHHRSSTIPESIVH